MNNLFSRFLLLVFHPLIMALLGAVILLFSSFYQAMVSTQVKTIILAEVFFGTVLLPMVLLLLKPRMLAGKMVSDQIFTSIQYLFTAFCYYLTYYLLSGITVAALLKVYFLAGSLVLVVMALLAMRFNISAFTVGPGAIAGLLLSLMLRLGTGSVGLLYLVIGLSGLIGYATLQTEKNNPAETYAGFIVGFAVLFLVISFIK